MIPLKPRISWPGRKPLSVPIPKTRDPFVNTSLLRLMVADDDGRLYMPKIGWYNPKTGRIEKGPQPADDTFCWFDRDSTHAYGIKPDGSLLRRWHLKTGETQDIGS